jgi:hypothetical protein
MRTCLACGRQIADIGDTCPQCTWPYALEGWEGNEQFRIDRITVDTNCVNSKHKNVDLNTLERWESERHILLQRSSAFLDEHRGPDARQAKAEAIAPHPQLFTIGISTLGGGDVLAGPDMQYEIRKILFPTTKDLTPTQAQDVEHLRQHVRTGGRAFLTLNVRDFIRKGKQRALSDLGIWVFTPQELVELLKHLYGYA